MPRLVKRYSNRKLYDTSESRYVTLDEIARWVKAGEDVKIVENESGEDLTAVTFAQIILEEERKKNGYLSLPLLRSLIQHGEAALQGIAATVDRGMEAIRTVPDARERVRSDERVDRLGSQRRLDEVVAAGRGSQSHPTFQQEMRRSSADEGARGAVGPPATAPKRSDDSVPPPARRRGRASNGPRARRAAVDATSGGNATLGVV